MIRIHKHGLYYYFLLIVSAYQFTLAYIFNVHQWSLREFALGKYVYPEQGRIFMALILRQGLRWAWLNKLVEHANKEHVRDPLVLVYGAVILVSLILASEFVRLSLHHLIGENLVATYGGLLVIYMSYFHFLLVPIFNGASVYDIPQVAVFSIALWSILRRRWWAFALVFAIGTLNRETTCFLVPMFLLIEGSRIAKPVQPRSYWILAGASIAMTAGWLYLYHFAMHFFSPQPTLAEYFHWRDNLKMLIRPWEWTSLPTTFGFLWLPFMLNFRWIQHRGLQWCAGLFPLWLAIMFVVGMLRETRLQSEWIPYVAICIGLIVFHRTQAFPGPGKSELSERVSETVNT